ncbi:hypothetical protein DM02DRAFT_652862 [Periconia macrospinosa]|uniref:Uncharacterized protein n=1 Tax=Periconia macrospinosa TaxID=97972 RepID=A0A2V1DYU3_9PLEO|nr:hypothetical protein DM02DRAFT_652862 [Periconia macrospinosa]
MSFDFCAFLCKLDPFVEYEFQSLSGGLINITVRATKTSHSDAGKFSGQGSLILKYAPPFIAAIGEEAPFSQTRQDVEARALALFEPPNGPLSELRQSTSISVPLLLHYDAQEHVLVFEDLGRLETLDNYLAAYSREKLGLDTKEWETCHQLGYRIGEFFAKLHNLRSLKEIQASVSGDLSNSLTRNLVLRHAVLPIKNHLLEYKIPDAETLFARVLDDYHRHDLPDELSFGLGDFTPSAVLLEATGDGKQRVAVIDWEFSREGRGPHGDMAQFLAALHLLLLAAPSGSSSFMAIEALVRATCSAYCRQSSSWLGQTRFNSGTVTRDLRLRLLRSALIMHGREIINGAVKCDCEWSRNLSVGSMVRVGAWYLERAGNDVEDMISDANWFELLKEDNRIILDLMREVIN